MTSSALDDQCIQHLSQEEGGTVSQTWWGERGTNHALFICGFTTLGEATHTRWRERQWARLLTRGGKTTMGEALTRGGESDSGRGYSHEVGRVRVGEATVGEAHESGEATDRRWGDRSASNALLISLRTCYTRHDTYTNNKGSS